MGSVEEGGDAMCSCRSSPFLACLFADDAGGSEDEGGDGFDAERPERVQ